MDFLSIDRHYDVYTEQHPVFDKQLQDLLNVLVVDENQIENDVVEMKCVLVGMNFVIDVDLDYQVLVH